MTPVMNALARLNSLAYGPSPVEEGSEGSTVASKTPAGAGDWASPVVAPGSIRPETGERDFPPELCGAVADLAAFLPEVLPLPTPSGRPALRRIANPGTLSAGAAAEAFGGGAGAKGGSNSGGRRPLHWSEAAAAEAAAASLASEEENDVPGEHLDDPVGSAGGC